MTHCIQSYNDMSWLRNNGLKMVSEWHAQNAERKKKGKIKTLSQKQIQRIRCYQACTTRNSKGNPSDFWAKTPSGKPGIQKGMKYSRNGE